MTTAVVFPSTLPGPSVSTVAPSERRLLSDLVGGPPQSRGVQRDYLAVMNVEWSLLDAVAAAAFDDWWKNTLTYGGAWFASTWPAPQGWTALVRRFIGAPKWTHLAGGFWRVTAQVQVRGRGLAPTADLFTASYWNLLDVNQLVPQPWTVSLKNRRAQIAQSPGGIMQMRANAPKSSGKLYFEEVFVAGVDGSFDAFQMILGACKSTDPLPTTGLATPPNFFVGVVNGNVGRVYYGVGVGSATKTGFPGLSNGSVVGFAYDLNAQLGWISLNGTYAGGGDPAAGTSPYITLFTGAGCYPITPCIQHQDAGGTAGLTVDLHLQATEFVYAAPAGFSPWLT